MTRRDAILAGLAPLAGAAAAQSGAAKIERWGVYETSYPGPSTGTPYLDVKFAAECR